MSAKLTVQRAAWAAMGLGVAWYAAQGGEYGTTDLRRQTQRRAALQATVDSLQGQVDSLRALERRLRTDPALQERIAREEFGLVRGDRELLYRFADPAAPGSDSSVARNDGSTP
jgi:cell division protein FtsB